MHNLAPPLPPCLTVRIDGLFVTSIMQNGQRVTVLRAHVPGLPAATATINAESFRV
ncbi:hypothetical protein [Azospirillum argentinense]|uniref:Uncharacterized protein n=1 Tax=Azospirillum argentinense TaxID=2970906 RepID=A0A5B0KM46_9PROT|nr:hypothetical protein [Azospirillum argentinense]KAA1052961.1 hypothetical protein FH063_003368 [Azospirillum argentinense]